MSAAEFTAWRAFDTIAPIGDHRLARQSALTSAILWNANRGPKTDALTVDDFDLYRDRRVLTRSEEEAKFREAFHAAGLVIVKDSE